MNQIAKVAAIMRHGKAAATTRINRALQKKYGRRRSCGNAKICGFEYI
jgi:hypothetical protein